jgi:protein gp37
LANRTSIEWTDRSANPIRARHKVTGKVGWHCVKVSPGCAHCYAERINRRLGTGLDFTRHAADQVELFLDRRPLEAILKLRKPQRIFLGDMTDLFQDGVSDDDLLRIWCVMEEARHHTFQVLTKRPVRMRSWLDTAGRGGTAVWARWPLPNVHLGVSVEDQARADERIPALLEIPAAVRFLSVEPLLGPIDLGRLWWMTNGESEASPYFSAWPGINWVIVGGESGPGARPLHPDWARSIRDQCAAAGVPFFFKQWGEWAPDGQSMPFLSDAIGGRGSHVARALFPDGHHLPDLTGRGANGDEAVVVRRVGKKAAGRVLDGRTWDEMPTAAQEVA